MGGGGQFIDLKLSIIKTLTLEGYSSLWFLPTIFFAELLLTLINTVSNNKKCVYLLLILISIALQKIINEYYYSVIIRFVIFINRILISYIFILVGTFIYKILKHKKLFDIMTFMMLFINMFICHINGFVDLHFSIINNYFLYFYFAISTSFSLLYISKNFYKGKSKIFKFIEYLGKNSLLIMITHLPLMILGIIFNMIYIENVLIKYCFTTILVLLAETVLIKIINKHFIFLVKPTNLKIVNKK